MTNPIEQYLQIQVKTVTGDWVSWFVPHKRMSVTERQEALDLMNQLREKQTLDVFRLVSIAVTLLSEQGEGGAG